LQNEAVRIKPNIPRNIYPSIPSYHGMKLSPPQFGMPNPIVPPEGFPIALWNSPAARILGFLRISGFLS